MRLSSILLSACAALCLTACGGDEDGDQPGSGEGMVLMCSDAESADNQDADGDGFTPCDGDCNDDDAAFYPGADDVPDDRIDHDCDNWMPERT